MKAGDMEGGMMDDEGMGQDHQHDMDEMHAQQMHEQEAMQQHMHYEGQMQQHHDMEGAHDGKGAFFDSIEPDTFVM